MTASTASRRALDATFTRFRNEVAAGRFVRQNAAQLVLACVHHDPSLKLARELCIALGTTLEAFRERCRAELERRKAERTGSPVPSQPAAGDSVSPELAADVAQNDGAALDIGQRPAGLGCVGAEAAGVRSDGAIDQLVGHGLSSTGVHAANTAAGCPTRAHDLSTDDAAGTRRGQP